MKNSKKTIHKKKWFVATVVLIVTFLTVGLLITWDTNRHNLSWGKIGTDGETFSFFVEGNILYFDNTFGSLYALDRKKGSFLWEFKAERPLFSYPVIHKNTIFVTGAGGVLYGVDKRNGKELWRFENPDFYLFGAPHVYRDNLYVSDSIGRLFLLDVKKGTKRWMFSSKPFYRDRVIKKNEIQLGSVNTFSIEGNNLFYASPDGTLYVLNPKTGSVKWTYDSGQQFSLGQIVIDGNSIFFSNERNNIIALNKKSGKLLWARPNSGTGVKCLKHMTTNDILFKSWNFHLNQYGRLVQFFTRHLLDSFFIEVSGMGEITLISTRTGNAIWQTNQLGSTLSCPSDSGGLLYFGMKEKVFSVDITNGKTIWTYQQKNSIFNEPLVNMEWDFLNLNLFLFTLHNQQYLKLLSLLYKPITIYARDTNGLLLALNAQGQKLWSFSASGFFSYPFIDEKFIYFSSSDGSFYRLNRKTGTPTIPKQDITIKQETEQVGKNTIFEITINCDDRYYDNPWKDVIVTAQFTHSSHKTFTIYGFYYDKNTWKVRFNAPIKGQWNWNVAFTAPGNNRSFSGEYTSTTDTYLSFLKIYEKNRKRFTIDNATIFNGIGIGDTIIDTNKNGSPLDDWFIEDPFVPDEVSFANWSTSSSQLDNQSHSLDIDSYLTAYATQGKFNMFRWSVNNASFNLWNEFTVNNKFNIREGKIGDSLVKSLNNHGFQIWMTMFGFEVPFGLQYPNELTAMRQYIRYVVARYGPYVSIWEIANESYAPRSLIQFIAKEIRAVDIENRPISMSHAITDIDEVSVIDAHWYENEDKHISDIATVKEISKYGSINKPLVFAEQGNHRSDYPDRSRLRMRVRAWTAFFNEAILIFWNSSSSKKFSIVDNFYNANLYIGQRERQEIAYLQRFTTGVDLTATKFDMEINNSQVRGYGLTSYKEIMGYLYHFINHEVSTIVSITVPVARSGKLIWYEPETGKVLVEQNLVSGTQTITSPDFTVDIAFKVTYEQQ